MEGGRCRDFAILYPLHFRASASPLNSSFAPAGDGPTPRKKNGRHHRRLRDGQFVYGAKSTTPFFRYAEEIAPAVRHKAGARVASVCTIEIHERGSGISV